jgi:hypothetical protein
MMEGILSVTYPKSGSRDAVDTVGRQLTAAKVSRAETSHMYPRPLNEPTAKPRLEAECMPAGYLKTGIEHLSTIAGRQIIQAAGKGVEGSPDIDVERHSCSMMNARADQQVRLAAIREQRASIAAQPQALWLSTPGVETSAPVETGLVPAQMQLEATKGATGVSRGTTGICRGAIGVCRGTTGVCRGATGVCRGAAGVCRGATGVSRGATGVLRGGTGVSRGICRGATCVCRGTTGVRRGATGACRGATGVSRGATGVFRGATGLGRGAASACRDRPGTCRDTTGVCKNEASRYSTQEDIFSSDGRSRPSPAFRAGSRCDCSMCRSYETFGKLGVVDIST